jgi:ATP-dependent DNA helicase DinG
LNDSVQPGTDTVATGCGSLLDGGGVFEARLEGFAPREAQICMANEVEAALAEGRNLVIEAGTGIGKTFAYLGPALLSGERVIISTGTKTLQDQLYFRDLPLVREALQADVDIALLKGRANYLCIYRMNKARQDARLPSRQAVAELDALRDWAARTPDGDLSISPVVSRESGLMPLVTSTVDNCLGSECPDFDECWVARARRKAQDADVVVVNHHLLFADMALKQSGFGEVLPGAGAFIVDEAHQAPETASQFFSLTFSSRQVSELCRDFKAETADLPGSLGTLKEPLGNCAHALESLQASVADQLPERGSWAQFLASEPVCDGLRQLDDAIAGLCEAADPLAGGSRGMDNCIDRAAEVRAVLDRFDSGSEPDEVRWFERRGKGFALMITPLNVASAFTQFRENMDAAWLFTSATLTVNGEFEHFQRQMGLFDAATLQLESPFDYANNAVLWLPRGLPEPRDPEFVPLLLEKIEPVLEASQGRAFLLFTSHRALRRAAEWLHERVDFPLFVQGESPRSLLLEAFRGSGNGVLLGSASFWEGVDVMGDALSLVVIDKLPFAAPDDPVMSARSEQLRSEGENPFMKHYLPQAVIALKQGAGRLIRDVRDRGALVICDPRIESRSYGRVFLDSLPPMRRVDSREEVEAFFQ